MAAETMASGQPGPVIDKLLDFHVANDGTAYYQVKWKPTWERADALLQFTDLIDAFWNFVNNASTGNIFNNQSIIKGPDPILPAAPAPTPPIQMNVQTTPKSTPAPQKQTPKQKKNAGASLQKQFNTMSSPHNRIQPPPTPPLPVQAVVIDSDDEDIAEVPAPTNIPNISANDSMNTMSSLQQQQQYQMAPMWNVQPKSEPSDIPDQKPFQGNQQFNMANFNPQQQMQQAQMQQQFQFPVQNVAPSPNGRGRGGRGVNRGGRGRGGGDSTGAKRKNPTQNPVAPSPNKMPNAVKLENSEDMTSAPHMFGLSESSPSNDNFGGNWESPQLNDLNESSSNDNCGGKWEDTFEIIEKKNFDGTSLETQYKCTICGTVITNKGSCRRHYNSHSGKKSHKCPICQKAFHRLDYMQNHLKTHGQGGGKELEGLIKLAMESVKKR